MGLCDFPAYLHVLHELLELRGGPTHPVGPAPPVERGPVEGVEEAEGPIIMDVRTKVR